MNANFSILSLSLFLFVAGASEQRGGNFAITDSVIASGSAKNVAGGAFSLDGTVGQSIAGNAMRGSPFAVTSGFWNFTPIAPTAANVSVGGRIRTANGNGIRNVFVSLVSPTGETRFANSSSFGYYSFENVPVGETYILSVTAKKFSFIQPTIDRTIFEATSYIDFVAHQL